MAQPLPGKEKAPNTYRRVWVRANNVSDEKSEAKRLDAANDEAGTSAVRKTSKEMAS